VSCSAFGCVLGVRRCELRHGGVHWWPLALCVHWHPGESRRVTRKGEYNGRWTTWRLISTSDLHFFIGFLHWRYVSQLINLLYL